MINVEDLCRSDWPMTAVNAKQGWQAWYKAKPLLGPMIWRLKDAWKVLWGTAVAVRFEEDNHDGD